VGKFRSRLVRNKAYAKQEEYRKLVEQLDTYWQRLFADPITVKTAAGILVVQPQRTNNVLLPAGFHYPQDPAKPFPGRTNGGFVA
jgi:hypothetical protein